VTSSSVAKKSWTDRLTDWMERMAPFFDEPHLASIRDGLAGLMPLLILGAFTLLFVQFPIRGWLDYLDANPALSDKLWVPFNMTYGLLSVFASITIAYHLARRKGLDPLMPTALSLLAFFVVASPIWGELTFGTYLDNQGLFTAIIVALVAVEIYNWFVKRNLVITMPPGVPPSITAAFVALIPAIAIFALAWLVRVVLGIDIAHGVVVMLSHIIPAASSYVAVAIAETMHAFLWTLGIHGDLTIGIVLSPIWTSNVAANALAAAAKQPLPWIYSDLFRAAYVVPGGSGCTLPLAFYLLRSKSARLRRVGQLGIWPGIFNINEPITFGTPVIFNPVMAIPFIAITFINATVAYVVHLLGLVQRSYIAAPWTLPGPFLAYLQTGYDIRAVFLAILCEFIIPGIIWYPFFKAWERQVLEKEGA
jgi:PTS system cellobiose-specific IIC component